MGELKIDLLKWSNHLKTGELPTLINNHTRLTDHSTTLIDHIYANKKDIVSTSGITLNYISNNFGVFAIIKRKILNNLKTDTIIFT